MLPTVGCNSAVGRLRLNVWCSAHTDLGDANTCYWMNTGNHDCIFFMRKFITHDGARSVDMVEKAQQVLTRGTIEKLFWVDGGDSEPDFFSREPYCYGLNINSPVRYSSGLLAADIALKLGAREIVLIGFDYAVNDGAAHWHEDKTNPSYGADKYDAVADYNRLKSLHLEYFKYYPIPVQYIGPNEELKRFHAENNQ